MQTKQVYFFLNSEGLPFASFLEMPVDARFLCLKVESISQQMSYQDKESVEGLDKTTPKFYLKQLCIF